MSRGWAGVVVGERTRLDAAPPRSSLGLARLLIDSGATLCVAALPVSTGAATAGFAAAGVGCVLARPRLWRSPGFVAGCAFGAWVLGTIAWAMLVRRQEKPFVNLGFAYGWIAIPMLSLALANPRVAARALTALALTMSATLALGIVQFVVGFDDSAGLLHVSRAGIAWARVSGFLASPLVLGTVAGFSLAAFAWWRPRAPRPWVAWLGMAASGAAVALSGSRMPQMATAVGVAVVALGSGARARRALPLIAAVVLLGVGVVALRTPERLLNPLLLRDGRVYIWRVSTSLWREHPITGLGGRAEFQRRYPERWHELVESRESDLVQREEHVRHAHDAFLALAVEHGLPAAVLYALYLVALARGFRGDRTCAALAWSALVQWLLGNTTNVLSTSGDSSLAFATCVGLAFGAVAVLQPAADRVVGEAPRGRDEPEALQPHVPA